jgi:branched-chain amino acid transport system permease protein
MVLPTTNWSYDLGTVFVNWTQILGLLLGILVTIGTGLFLRYTSLGTAMRALANDREITATLGVPVRRVEAAAWLGSGLISGAAGLLLSNLVGLDAATLTFLVISSLAAALIARLESITVTLIAGIVVGVVTAGVTPFLSISQYRDMAPFVLAIVALLFLSRHRVVTVSRGAH